MKLLLIAVLSTTFIQTAKAPVKTPPIISIEQKMEFFKAQSAYQDAALRAQQAELFAQQKLNLLNDKARELNKTCGEGFQATIDPQGYPVCTVIPELKPEPASKK